jgi:Holliday junction resolvase RusA-like endonuclease
VDKNFFFDGLVKAGIIKNDGWKEVISFTHRFEVDKHHPRLEVEIREVNHGAFTGINIERLWSGDKGG